MLRPTGRALHGLGWAVAMIPGPLGSPGVGCHMGMPQGLGLVHECPEVSISENTLNQWPGGVGYPVVF